MASIQLPFRVGTARVPLPPQKNQPTRASLLQKDLAYLQQWLEAFVMNFEKVIAVPSLEPRR